MDLWRKAELYGNQQEIGVTLIKESVGRNTARPSVAQRRTQDRSSHRKRVASSLLMTIRVTLCSLLFLEECFGVTGRQLADFDLAIVFAEGTEQVGVIMVRPRSLGRLHMFNEYRYQILRAAAVVRPPPRTGEFGKPLKC